MCHSCLGAKTNCVNENDDNTNGVLQVVPKTLRQKGYVKKSYIKSNTIYKYNLTIKSVTELFGALELSIAPVRCLMELRNHECSAPGAERSSSVDFSSGVGAKLNKFLRRTRSGAETHSAAPLLVRA